MTGRDFPTQDLRNLVYGDGPEALKVVTKEITDTSRWSTLSTMIFQDTSTGQFYRADYSEGATEYQDERPFEDDGDSYTCTEVIATEKTVTVYVPKGE